MEKLVPIVLVIYGAVIVIVASTPIGLYILWQHLSVSWH